MSWLPSATMEHELTPRVEPTPRCAHLPARPAPAPKRAAEGPRPRMRTAGADKGGGAPLTWSVAGAGAPIPTPDGLPIRPANRSSSLPRPAHLSRNDLPPGCACECGFTAHHSGTEGAPSRPCVAARQRDNAASRRRRGAREHQMACKAEPPISDTHRPFQDQTGDRSLPVRASSFQWRAPCLRRPDVAIQIGQNGASDCTPQSIGRRACRHGSAGAAPVHTPLGN